MNLSLRAALVGTVASLSLLTGCSEKPASNDAAKPTVVVDQPTSPVVAPAAPTAEPPPAPVDAAVAYAKALDEEKLKKLLGFEKEMLPHTALILNTGRRASENAQKNGTDMAAELSKDERRQKIREVTEAAMSQSGVTQTDVTGFAMLSGEFFAKEMAIDSARKQVADNEARKAKDPKTAYPDEMIKVYQDQIDEHAAYRKSFAEKYGEPTLALMDKYQPEFVAIRAEQVAVLMGKK